MSYVESAGAKIWWESIGSGEPVVLISGFTSDSDAWFRVVPHLENYRVILIDNRGTGKSDAPWGVYSYAQMAADIAKVLEAAGETSAHVIGISMGSCIAQEFVLNHPQMTRTVSLVSSNPGVKHAVLPDAKIRLKVGAVAFSNSRRVHGWLEEMTYQPSTYRARLQVDTDRRRGLKIRRRGLFGQLLGVTRWDRHDDLPQITVPTLVLHGDSDGIDPVENARILGRQIRHAELVILQDTNHQVFTDSEEESMKVIKDFMAKHPA